MDFSSEEAKKALSKQAKKERNLLIKEFMCAAMTGILANSYHKYGVNLNEDALMFAENASDLYLARINK